MALSKICLSYTSLREKNMQSSSIFHVHSIWVNTFILVEHLTL